MSRPERIGVLGGTFDPLHNAHCALARAALDGCGLDRVLFVVSARPPHKSEGPHATPEERLAMVQAALADEPRMVASSIEIDRKGPSYTRDTLRELRRHLPNGTFFLIVGFDMLLDFPNWRDPQGILAEARLLAVPRPGLSESVPSDLKEACDMLPFEETSLSSTEVRQRVAAGESVTDLVPSAVERFIRRWGLYECSVAVRQIARAPEFITLLSERLREKTRRHSLATADFMLSHARQMEITDEHAVTVGLLHDLGKSMNKAGLLRAAERFGIVPNDAQRQAPKLLHGPVAAEECRRCLGIEDDAVYEAVYWHTTGRPGLGRPGLALYVADFAEPTRMFPEAGAACRILRDEGFKEALYYVADQKMARLRAKVPVIDPMSEAFHAWLDGQRGSV